ncbi:MAG: trypsin-like peptidase domain-containing protein [Bacillota bacterium]
MKKILLILLFVFTLSGCELAFEEPESIDDTEVENDALTQEEIESLIEDAIDERESYYMSEEDLTVLIQSLIPSTLSEDEIITIVSSHVPTDLTETEIEALITSLLPEDRYETLYDATSLEDIITDILESTRESMVGVRNIQTEGGSSGSGVIYKRDLNTLEGQPHTYYVVTNHHVIEDYESLEIVYEKNGLLYDIPFENITFLGSDASLDVAVLTFTSEKNFTPIEFTDSYELEIGELVFAVGNPLGFTYYGTATMGIVSGTSRFMSSGDFSSTVIQHDASISPGNSGGALLDINGKLIGINNMKIDQDQAANLGFAIPSNTVERAISEIEDIGEVIRPFLGISSQVYYSGCDQERGACIETLVEGGVAENTDLQVGDIITGFKYENDTEFMEVYNFNNLLEYIINSQVGDRVIIRYIRDETTYETNVVTLDVRPEEETTE